MKTIAIATGLTFIAVSAPAFVRADTLTVYAPDYFASEWGPGPAIAQAFEAATGHQLNYVTGDVLPRLRLEGDATEADVVIGLNTDTAQPARETGLFAPHNVDTTDLTLPVEWTDPIFLPFNWGHSAFVYDKTLLEDAPTSFADLRDAPDDLRIVVQDPRSSASGLALGLWMHQVFGDEAEAVWADLADNIVTVTAGWSEAYGMFTEGEVDMVFSYTTSPAYHIIAEGDETKAAAIFPEGHYVTVETVAQVAGTDQPDLAQAFMDFVLSPDFQSIIPTGNWSFPAKQAGDLPAGFEKLAMPDTALIYTAEEAEALRETVVNAFEAGLGR